MMAPAGDVGRLERKQVVHPAIPGEDMDLRLFGMRPLPRGLVGGEAVACSVRAARSTPAAR